jgi:hypothetical protein
MSWEFPALRSTQEKCVLRIFIALNIHRHGRVQTPKLWVQWQKHYPLHHQGDCAICTGGLSRG